MTGHCEGSVGSKSSFSRLVNERRVVCIADWFAGSSSDVGGPHNLRLDAGAEITAGTRSPQI